MYTRLLFVLIATFSLFACQPQAEETAKFSEEELTQQKQAWEKMIEGHDVVMPLMSNMHQAATQLKALTADSTDVTSDLHQKSVYVLERLEKASDGMMDWMAGISDNPLDSLRARYPDHAAVMASIDKESTIIQEVGDQMINSLQDAKKILELNGTPLIEREMPAEHNHDHDHSHDHDHDHAH